MKINEKSACQQNLMLSYKYLVLDFIHFNVWPFSYRQMNGMLRFTSMVFSKLIQAITSWAYVPFTEQYSQRKMRMIRLNFLVVLRPKFKYWKINNILNTKYITWTNWFDVLRNRTWFYHYHCSEVYVPRRFCIGKRKQLKMVRKRRPDTWNRLNSKCWH